MQSECTWDAWLALDGCASYVFSCSCLPALDSDTIAVFKGTRLQAHRGLMLWICELAACLDCSTYTFVLKLESGSPSGFGRRCCATGTPLLWALVLVFLAPRWISGFWGHNWIPLLSPSPSVLDFIFLLFYSSWVRFNILSAVLPFLISSNEEPSLR